MTTAVYLERGKRRTFACAVDRPGWCRSGRDDAAALDALLASVAAVHVRSWQVTSEVRYRRPLRGSPRSAMLRP